MLNIVNLGTTKYIDALNVQKSEKQKVIEGKSSGTIFVTEHNPSVITLGVNAKSYNVLASESELLKKNYEIIRINRGGDVTVHEKGQMVVYFVIPVRGLSIKKFIRKICEDVSEYIELKTSLKTQYIESTPGLWINNKKICAIGFDFRDRVSMHGLALNVCNSMQGFNLINPCGFTDKGVTSIQKETGKNIDFEDFTSVFSSFILKKMQNT